MPNSRSAICLVIDRLSAAYLGALGNAWIHTPAFDRLAAESHVFHRALIDSPAVAEVYGSYWTGEPAWLSASREATSAPSLAQSYREHSLPTVLITDDVEIAGRPLSSGFDEIIRIAQPDEQKQAADWQETQLARFFSAVVEVLIDREAPALVWLHTGALGRIWDSPQALRDAYAAEDDPSAATLVEPPSYADISGADPDFLLGLRHAYAGEIAVLDHCLSTLLDTVAESNWSDALFIATSCRGYPLGEHGIVGRAADHLFGELVHVPCLMRLPRGPKYGARSQDLVQPADLYTTLRHWLTPDEPVPALQPWYAGRSLLDAGELARPKRFLAFARSPSGEMALTTPVWFARVCADMDNATSHPCAPVHASETASRKLELYVKPDDYHEANEVSDRCLDIVDEFREVVQALDGALAQGVSPEITLSDDLARDWEIPAAG